MRMIGIGGRSGLTEAEEGSSCSKLVLVVLLVEADADDDIEVSDSFVDSASFSGSTSSKDSVLGFGLTKIS